MAKQETSTLETAVLIEAALRERLERQAEHPVYPRIVLLGFEPATLQAYVRIGLQRLLLDVEEVDKLRQQRENACRLEITDRFRYRCEPDIWRQINLRMARKRLENPGVQLELLIMGGIRSGKTDFTHSRATIHFFYTLDAWVWGLHETETSSKTIQQKRIMDFFPPEMNPLSGKLRKDRKTKLNYSDGGGFTGNAFHLVWKCKDETGRDFVGGGLFDFKFYKSADSTLQGAELTSAVSDELVPRKTCNTVRERLLSRAADTRRPAFLARIRQAVELLERGESLPGPLLGAIYHGVHLIGFTPKEGYSATVQDFLDGAVTLDEVDAELLPLSTGGFKKVPRFKQPRKATRLVAYLHTYDNAHKGNWLAMVTQCQGATEQSIRVIAYGDVSKGWAVRYPRFRDTLHVINRDQVPRVGTWYHVVDPAGDRNWFMIWALCAPDGRLYVVREWPQEGDFIPDIGDPGAWAITSEHGRRNGDRGPAQEGFGWGFERYKKEIERVETELGCWWDPASTAAAPKSIEVAERYMDSRLGAAPTPQHGASTTIIEGMAEVGMDFMPASGDRLREGDSVIQDRLDYHEAAGAMGAPRLFVNADCHATVFMFQNYGDPAKPDDEACKDPRDVLAYLCLAEPVYLNPAHRAGVSGGSFGAR